MRAGRAGLCCVLVIGAVLVATAACAASTADELKPWSPAASWQGQKDYDPRLDRPVQCWQAALTLEGLFVTVAQQTGGEDRVLPRKR